MFSWAITFFIIALIAAVFGFFGIAASAAGIAKIIFVVALSQEAGFRCRCSDLGASRAGAPADDAG